VLHCWTKFLNVELNRELTIMSARLGLGTVQFGLDYGVMNDSGKPNTGEIGEILQCALDAGISVFDTSPEYGASEALLGQLLPRQPEINVVTKTPTFTDLATITKADAKHLLTVFETSLRVLGRASVYGLLVHNSMALCRPGAEHLIDTLRRLRADGRVEKLGVSVYSAQDIDSVLDLWIPDFVQLPLSIADQRLLKSGHVAELKTKHVEIHARSIFLQGALLANATELPSFLALVAPLFEKIERSLGDTSKLAACLGFIQNTPEIDIATVGVNSITHLREILDAQRSAYGVDLDYADLAIDDDRYVDPRRWPR